MEISVNYLSVLVAAIAAMVVGFLWYGPLFGRKWIGYMGWSEAQMAAGKKSMGGRYFTAFIGTLVMALVLAHFITQIGITPGDTVNAWKLAGWVWLGFFVTKALGGVLWEGKPLGLFFLNIFHDLAALGVATTVLVMWK